MAESLFEGDYADTLRYLLHIEQGYLAKPDDEVMVQINLLAEEVNKLKIKIESLNIKPEEKKIIRMVSGRTIEK